MAGSTPVLLVDDLRIVARLKLLAANHLPPNQERTPHAYYLFLSLWSCRFSLSYSLSLSPFFPPSPLQPRLILQHPVSFFFALLTHKNPCKGKEGDGDGSVRREKKREDEGEREKRASEQEGKTEVRTEDHFASAYWT